MQIIDSPEAIRAVLGEPGALTARKIKTRLDEAMRTFIARSPLLMLATVDAEGFPAVSPRGDGPGFVQVVDDTTLRIPERKGNRLALGLTSLLGHPRAGLLFLVPGTAETLRVQGSCRILHDPVLNRAMASATQSALLVLEMRVHRCFFHCGKALLRSAVWQPQGWPPAQDISFGTQILGDAPEARQAAVEFDAAVRGRYQTDL